MKKILIIVLMAALAWIAKLSYDVWGLSTQQATLLNEMHQIEQRSANLNDQVVAMQRQKETLKQNPATVNAMSSQPAELVIEGIDPILFIKQQLDLVEFALKQQQYVVATDKLAFLDMQLEKYNLAVALKQSLHQVIARDMQTIQKFVAERNEQQALINRQLQQIDQALSREIQQPQLNTTRDPSEPFWKQWLRLEPAQAPATALMQRQIVLKEAQLRLLLARQALAAGQYTEYQKDLTEVMLLIQQLPDPKAKELLKQLNKLKTLVVVPTPILSTRALLG